MRQPRSLSKTDTLFATNDLVKSSLVVAVTHLKHGDPATDNSIPTDIQSPN